SSFASSSRPAISLTAASASFCAASRPRFPAAPRSAIAAATSTARRLRWSSIRRSMRRQQATANSRNFRSPKRSWRYIARYSRLLLADSQSCSVTANPRGRASLGGVGVEDADLLERRLVVLDELLVALVRLVLVVSGLVLEDDGQAHVEVAIVERTLDV